MFAGESTSTYSSEQTIFQFQNFTHGRAKKEYEIWPVPTPIEHNGIAGIT